MEWLWRPSDSFAIGFCGLDKAQRSIAFLAFWCSICCGYRPLNQQIDNIHSFIFCKDFAPSMKLPLVNKLQDNFKSRLECFVFVFRFLYYYYYFFFIFFFIQKPLPYCSGRLMYADMSHLPTNKNGKVHRACASTVYADINHSAKRKVKTGFKPRIPTMWNIKYIKLSLRRTGERGGGSGGREGGCHSVSEVFLRFFLDNQIPAVFSGRSFIPRTHFETSLLMVSCYGYEIWRHKQQVVKPFLSENACFSTSFKSEACG